jgi:DNA polymerase-3 subunit alpha
MVMYVGLLPLFALNEEGYKRIIKLSSISFLENDEVSDPHVDFKELLEDNTGVAIFFRNYFWFIW